MTSEGQSDVTLPFRDQPVHITPAHKLFPGTGRLGAEGGQVQALRELLEPGGKLAVVDEPVLVRVELSKQSRDLVLGDAELAADRSKVLVLDPTRFVRIAGGEESPETRPLHRGMASIQKTKSWRMKKKRGVRFLCTPRQKQRCHIEALIGPNLIVGGSHLYKWTTEAPLSSIRYLSVTDAASSQFPCKAVMRAEHTQVSRVCVCL